MRESRELFFILEVVFLTKFFSIILFLGTGNIFLDFEFNSWFGMT